MMQYLSYNVYYIKIVGFNIDSTTSFNLLVSHTLTWRKLLFPIFLATTEKKLQLSWPYLFFFHTIFKLKS